MGSRKFLVALIFVLLLLVTAACTSAKPAVVISSPPSGSQYQEGDEVAIQSASADTQGVTRVELTIDGAVARNDTPPSPQTNFTIIQTWKATAGPHTIVVRAYNAAGATSDPAAISISASASAASSSSALTTNLTATPTPNQPLVSISPTPTPSTSAPTACTNNAAFVSDVSVPDGTVFAAGTTFVKTWRLSNSGTCAWGAGYQLVFINGEAMTGGTVVAAPVKNPGETADISVAMNAPAAAGNHTGTWRMRSPSNAVFGQSVIVKISVPGALPPSAPPAPPAGASGCTGTPVIASFYVYAPTASKAAAITVAAGTTVNLAWGDVTNADSVEIDHGIGPVAAPGSATDAPGSSTTYTLTAHCGSNSKTAQVTVTITTVSPIYMVTVAPPAYHLLIFKATGASVSRSCDPGNIKTNFAGTITANGSGSVTYRWEDTNGSRGGTYTLNFGAAGTLSTATTFRIHAGSGTIYIHVLTPNDFQSGGQSYNPTCP